MDIITTGALLFIIAAILAMFGKGGGEFYVPIFLALGIEYQKAATTSLFILMVSGTAMMLVFSRKALIDWKTGAAVITTSSFGSFIGGFISANIPSVYLKVTFALLLIISAYFIVNPPKKELSFNMGPIWHRECCGEKYDLPVLVVFPTIFLIGFIAGMVGISGGGLIVPLLILLGRMPLRTAFATNSVMVLFSSTLGFFGHSLSTGIDWYFTVVIAFFAATGAVLGASLSSRVKVENLKKMFFWILLIAALWMLWMALSK